MPGTMELRHHLRSPPDVVYKAFLDPAAMVKWLPPFGLSGTIHSMEAKVGGLCRMSFTNFRTGSSHAFTSKYVTLEPGKKIQYVDAFDDPKLAGEMGVTITFTPTLAGCFVEVVQKGIPDAIPVEFARMGWQESMVQLAQLVEPDIPDGAPE